MDCYVLSALSTSTIFSFKMLLYILLFFLNIHYLLHREVRGILLYQEFPRPILLTKHPERSEIGRGNPWLSKICNLPKK